MAEKTKSPLISVYSEEQGHGEACRAFSRHGYVGVEKEVVQAIRNWYLYGQVKDVHKD
jgi:hypothetical protein